MYFHLGVAISRIAHENVPEIAVNMTPVISSIINSKLIGSGEADFVIVQNDIGFYALRGWKPLFEKSVPNIRGVASLYSECVQILARKDAKINSVADLKGRKVAVGPPKSGPEQNSLQILEAYGLKFEDLGKVEWLTINESMNFLKENKIDALFFLGAVGYPAITGTASQIETVMVPIDDAHADLLIKKFPFYAKGKIPAGIYKGIDTGVPTVSVWTMLAARAELEEDIVYQMTKAIFENTKTMSAAHAVGKQVKLENALVGMPIPLHMGAEKFYREKGMVR
jgi:hypothetical protein